MVMDNSFLAICGSCNFTTESSSSFSFRIFAICRLMFILVTANNSALCFWLSQTRPPRDISDTCALPSSVVSKDDLAFLFRHLWMFSVLVKLLFLRMSSLAMGNAKVRGA